MQHSLDTVPTIPFVHGHLPFLDNVLDVDQFDFLGIKGSSVRTIDIMTAAAEVCVSLMFTTRYLQFDVTNSSKLNTILSSLLRT
jgi:predicted membrane-bound mannosyltransferase